MKTFKQFFKVSKRRTHTHLAVTGTGVEFGVGLGLDPLEALHRVTVTVLHVADGHGGRSPADVPDGHLTAGQAARQTVFVLVMELEFDDRIR